MPELRFSLVGPGRVGLSLASWLVARGAALELVATRRVEALTPIATSLGGRVVELGEVESAGQDLLIVSVSDTALAEAAEALAARPQADVVLHPSGILPVEVLAPLRRTGSSIGGFHPLRAFPEVSRSVEDAAGTVFGIGGDAAALELSRRLADSLGGQVVEVDDSTRASYHLAASLAAGGVVTMLAVAADIAARANLPDAVLDGYLQLARQALAHVDVDRGPADAITGPVARGDVETLRRHLDALARDAPESVELLVAISHATLSQLERAGKAPPSSEEMRSILSNSMERKSFLDRK